MFHAPPPAKIEVRGLVKRYAAKEAVCGISFSVASGTVFGLLGANGAGKTSVLECLLGLRKPDGGTVLVDGLDVGMQPDAVKRRIGAVLQSTDLQDCITPREALELFGAFYPQGLSTTESLHRFRLMDKAEAPFASLSGGQRQRLALALAFVHEPEILCLDEPTVGLDVQARRELHGLIRQWRTEGRTVLLTTHDTGEAHALCDEVAVLRAGRIVAQGPPAALIAQRGTHPRIVVRARDVLDPEALLQLPEVLAAEGSGREATLEVVEVGVAVVALVGWLKAGDNALVDLHVIHPSLEETLLELTTNGRNSTR